MQNPRRFLHSILRLRLRQGAGLLWLLLALVWAPTLGRLHQAVHGAPQALHHQAEHSAASADGARQFLLPLLAHHTPVDCLLFDQLALADTALGATQALPPAAPAVLRSPWQAAGMAVRHVVLFHARGPPPQALV